MRRVLGCGLTVLTAVLFVASGCSGSVEGADHPILGVKDDGTPKWVKRGSGTFDGDSGKAFFGVGIVQGVRNVALSRRTADDRARGEIAAMFDLYVARLLKDYQQSTTAEDFRMTTEEQDITATQKTVTDVTVRGIEIREHWTDPNTEALYALAVLELESMVQALENAKELSPRLRAHVRENAARAFDELSDALRERRQDR